MAVEAALTTLGGLAGPGSQAERRAAVRALLARATTGEQSFFVALLSGELRQGALAGLMADAVARAAGVPLAAVRRALTLHGELVVTAQLALAGGAEALAAVRLEVAARSPPCSPAPPPTSARRSRRRRPRR